MITTITVTPRNSDNGEASSLWLVIDLVVLASLLLSTRNFLFIKFSALNALMIRIPLIVSSERFNMVPNRLCPRCDFFLNLLDMDDMIRPETGKKTKVKNVSCGDR